MEILKSGQNGELIMRVKGRLDTNAAADLGSEIDKSLTQEVVHFVMDMQECDYVASSALRVIISAQKQMNRMQGTMVLRNVQPPVMDVFEMVGFADILSFE